MALAFELPQHLPHSQPQEISTSILTRVGEASDLNAHLTASWLAELDSAIQNTKSNILKRIQHDCPAFERQLECSIDIQRRLNDLSNNTDHLINSLNDSKTGISPNLLRSLENHKTLGEQTSDADVIHNALAYLLRIMEELRSLSNWVQTGKLSEAAGACERVQAFLAKAPRPLARAEIFNDIKKRYRTLNDQVVEQLGDAYARSIRFLDSGDSTLFSVNISTPVLRTSTKITLSTILRALSFDELSTRLSLLRRDIVSKFVEPALSSKRQIFYSTDEVSSTLTLTLSTSFTSPLQSLHTLNTFLDSHIFPHLPPSFAAYPTTFHSPIITTILTSLLKPSIPSSLTTLPPFLVIVDDAIRFELALLSTDARNRPIYTWAEDLASHYEKKRRESVMQHTRQMIKSGEDGKTVRKRATPYKSPTQPWEGQGPDTTGLDFDGDIVEEGKEDGAGSLATSIAHLAFEGDGDGYSHSEDPSDGWGWGDDVDEGMNSEVSATQLPLESPKTSPPDEEDDAWGDDWDTEPPPPPPPMPQPEPTASQHVPKLAKRLEKFSAKGKGVIASNTLITSSDTKSTLTSGPTPLLPTETVPQPSQAMEKKTREQETYVVSVRAIMILAVAEDLIREGEDLIRSNVFHGYLSPKSAISEHLFAAAPLVLDLYRALYPVVHSTILSRDPNIAMRWANDCMFLSDEVADLRRKGRLVFVEEKWIEAGERLGLLGKTWFEDVVAQQRAAVRNILVDNQGLKDLAKAERFETSKGAIERVLQEIISLSFRWKETLTNSAYLYALGQVVDEALFRVMDDILCLSDIPEADSEHLSELCDMLVPLEELFKDTQGKHSLVGVHVSLWFKFSYLPWLIKGSIADISYLFDQGMLVDYEIEELVRLLRALFAETPLRENAIIKISKGHPILGGSENL